MKPPAPVPDDLTAEFWAGVAEGELRIQRCTECRRYQHPPAPLCPACGSTARGFERVSGRATLHSWSEVRSGARHPAFVDRTPYLVALVQLFEQDDLYLYTNLPGAAADGLRAGLALELDIEQIGDGVSLPQFRLTAR